jgi:hypothetical protein
MAALRSELSESDAAEAGLRIAERILALPDIDDKYGKSPVIALFAPIRREPDLLSNANLFAVHGFGSFCRGSREIRSYSPKCFGHRLYTRFVRYPRTFSGVAPDTAGRHTDHVSSGTCL